MHRLTAELSDWLDLRLAHLHEGRSLAAPRSELAPLLLASDYAYDRLRRDPELAEGLRSPPEQLQLADADEASWPAQLRRFRHRHSLALIAAEVAGEPLERIVAGSSWLADHCASVALQAASRVLHGRHGVPRNAAGDAQQLLVLGLGKLGGYELNFSSDIDLIFAFPESGSTDGARALDNETFFQRLGQRLIQLLGEVTADGFGFRVDMRLRPFGNAGRLALSFAAMEQYYQRDGRDWERYAWIKARPIAGDLQAGQRLLETLRPFVYRRYLDYTAFEGLREMKAMIEAEVQRRDLADHLKLGPGGIREIEFAVQLQQMIRGGREPALRVSGLLPALQALEQRGHLQTSVATRLRAAYFFLRRLENRVQMLRDEQTHELPREPLQQARLAAGLGFPDWPALLDELRSHREVVRAEFTRVFEARAQRSITAETAPLRDYWLRIGSVGSECLQQLGIVDAERQHEQLQQLAAAAAAAGLSAGARARLDRVLPELLGLCLRQTEPGRTLERALRLLHAVLRRPSYLALLDEQPLALQRLVQTMARSALLADRIIAHPLLLDDLLDARADTAPPSVGMIDHELRTLASRVGDDLEQAILALNELRQSVAFRVGLATAFRRQSAACSAGQLADLAAAVLRAALPLAIEALRPAHGVLQDSAADAGLAIIGYGSLGGGELGFGSDLDLVFLFDSAQSHAVTDGPRPLEAARYQQRVVQKLLGFLSTLTAAGRLYEADLRLRPDGAKGLLLTSIQSFADYQRERAWTWEHQALVRARAIAGDPALCTHFAAVRRESLCRPRDPAGVRRDVAAMRARMRAELDRGSALRFDLKQGEGGLVDIEFLLQASVLAAAAGRPELIEHTATLDLLTVCAAAGLIAGADATALREAHAVLLQRSLECTLDSRPRLAALDDELVSACAAVRAGWAHAGLARAGTDTAGSAGDAALNIQFGASETDHA